MVKFIAETEKSEIESKDTQYTGYKDHPGTVVFLGLVGLTAWLFSDSRKLKVMEMEKHKAWHKAYLEFLNQPIITGSDVIIQNVQAQNLKSILQSNIDNAKSEEAKARANVVWKVANFLDPSILSEKQHKFMLRNIFAPDAPQARDPETQEELDNSLIQKSKAEADDATNETEFKKWKHDETKRNKGRI